MISISNAWNSLGRLVRPIPWYVPVFFIVVVFLFVMATRDASYVELVNQEVISSRNFSLSAESVGLYSSVSGTIFFKGDKNNAGSQHIEIVAWMNIAPQDMGGIHFNIYEGDNWRVTNIDSDYARDYSKPEDEIDIFTIEDSPMFAGGQKEITIGRHIFDLNPQLAGGSGSIVIELLPVKTKDGYPEHLKISVGVGFEDRTLYPVYEVIDIPLGTG